jgi:hypothetical protein
MAARKWVHFSFGVNSPENPHPLAPLLQKQQDRPFLEKGMPSKGIKGTPLQNRALAILELNFALRSFGWG